MTIKFNTMKSEIIYKAIKIELYLILVLSIFMSLDLLIEILLKKA